jgi:GAF domain-containing protein
MESAPDVMIVSDAKKDATNPLVLGPPFIRFYAGASLKINNTKIGTLCIIDTVPRSSQIFGNFEASMLLDMAAMVNALISERHPHIL